MYKVGGLTMRYIFDNDLHIHSKLSLCSKDDEQTTERILEYAKNNNLKTICLTDHYWDEKVEGASGWYEKQNYEHIAAAKPLPQADGIRFLFGCETEIDKYMTLGISQDRFHDFDFIVIPTTHLHMMGFTLDEEDDSIKKRAELWVKRLESLLNMNLPFYKIGIAHLACSLICNASREEYIKTLNLIKDEDLNRVFKKAAEAACGIELNSSDMNFSDEEAESVLRIFRVAKKCGCKFYFGSDAHHPLGLDEAKDIFERAIDLLELTEDDKFHVIK